MIPISRVLPPEGEATPAAAFRLNAEAMPAEPLRLKSEATPARARRPLTAARASSPSSSRGFRRQAEGLLHSEPYSTAGRPMLWTGQPQKTIHAVERPATGLGLGAGLLAF